MTSRGLRSLGSFTCGLVSMSMLVAIGIAPHRAAAQTGAEGSGTWAMPRTSFGQPDLQGIWDFATITPLERPKELAGKEFLTAGEAAQYEAQRFALVDHDTETGAEFVCRGTGNYNEFWYDRGFGDVVEGLRSSLIVDPPDGRIPALTDDAKRRPLPRRGEDSWEERGVAERCIIGFNAGPPMMPSAYNNYVQLIQSPEYVVIYNEMIHDARIVPLDPGPGIPDGIRQWSGVSRGRWEGDTLIVETTHFTDKTSFRGSTAQLKLTERFTRFDSRTLHYEFTVDDPSTFTSAWTARVPMTKSDAVVHEYACHEGNYGLLNILSGARTSEREP